MLDIQKLADKRKEIGKKQYGELWKNLTKYELYMMIMEELADTINYLEFSRRNDYINKDKEDELVRKMIAIKKSIDEVFWNGGEV